MKNKMKDVVLFNIGAVVVGLVISACMLLFMDVNPVTVFSQAFMKIITDKYTMGEVLVKATPLMFTALAFAFTYKANLFNIGAQGQFYAGAIVAVTLSLLRKTTLFVLTLVLPAAFGATGAFFAEPAADVLGGIVSTAVFLHLFGRLMREREQMPDDQPLYG